MWLRRRRPPARRAWVLALALTAGCGNDCLDMCQQFEVYLNDCGYGWSTAFPNEGWASIDDCYDDHWEAGDGEEASCLAQTEEYDGLACY